MTPLRVQAAACTLSFSGSLDLSRGILPRTFFLSFRGAKRRGICCPPTFGHKQISRFARNDKGSGSVEAGLEPPYSFSFRGAAGDEESAVLQLLVKSRFLASLEKTMIGVVEAYLEPLLLVIPRSRSDEESAVLQLLVKSRFLASLEMTRVGVAEAHTF